ncbi:OLC1v1014149C1 [Oldenlandia corymbosa var. corymbosa]|uniref:OLC1v1014149C1 n=1 Tax=Oldenlandia corymbosa var. corymbosa TaxID=529605 RepID=A0AAV1E042_OLDCO|nr:OLC1v1014149C1 [Oldenlandia corymbosa var. corymbosa]
MAAKRFFDDSDNDPVLPANLQQKRVKTSKLSFASVIKEVLTLNFMENLSSTLEPMIRRVVHEEVEDAIRRNQRSLTRTPSLRIQGAIDEPPSFQLVFSQKLALPIFTGTKILDSDNRHLQILLIDPTTSCRTSLPYPIKIEIVVLDGDFPPGGDLDRWNIREFDENVLRERAGKRPLLAGELCVTMRDGLCTFGELEFTDNSSWIRSRKFRLGARVVHGSSSGGGGGGDSQVRIRPAMTEEAFIVKDHRGELYKKHYPPALHDEVWRLEKIGKGGAFHRKLSAQGIRTVQDFLKLSVVDPLKLKKILGINMSEKMWEVTLKHAWTCEKGTKMYISRGPNFEIFLNPVCQVIKAVINGQVYATRDLNMVLKTFIQRLVKDAYANWSTLDEVDGHVNETALLSMGDQFVGQPYPIRHGALLTDGSNSVNPNQTNGHSNCQQVEYNNDEWDINCSYLCNTPIEPTGRYFPEASPEDDLP